MSDRNTVLVIGAGPTGLTAALELARQGRAVTIVERNAEVTPLAKAVGISSHSLDLLGPSGVAERLLSEGVRLQRVFLSIDGERVGALDLSQIPHRYNFLLSLPQSRTEEIMVERLAEMGVEVRRRTELVTIRQQGSNVLATLRQDGSETSESFTHAYGADGMHSTVRQALDIAFEGYVHERLWSIADVHIEDWPEPAATAHAFLLPGGEMVFIIPIAEKRYRIISNTADAVAHVRGLSALGHKVLLADTFHVSIKQASAYSKGGICIGGDAAHVHSPVGGRGMNLGIEDSVAFVRHLTAGTLDVYGPERRPVGARWIKLSERFLSMAQMDNPLLVPLRNVALKAFAAVPSLQRIGLSRVAGVVE